MSSNSSSIITGPTGPLPDGPIIPDTPLIVVPESDLILPPGARVEAAPAAPARDVPNLRDHPLVTAPIIFAGLPKVRRALSERSKSMPGANRAQKRRRAKQAR